MAQSHVTHVIWLNLLDGIFMLPGCGQNERLSTTPGTGGAVLLSEATAAAEGLIGKEPVCS